ncbi:MAG: HEAT repeat domain-containing protein, partial [Pirellulaceae bacterium]|nr:HEAT repeat domain-containing protein [Pirellulaceae bacterium]
MRTFWLFVVAACCNLVVPQFTLAQVRDASLEQLVTQLTDANVDARRDAAYELVRRVDDSKEVIQALGKATTDQDVQVRIQSLTALARVGKKSAIVIPELIKCLSDRDAQVRFRAAGALGAVGSPAIEPLTSLWEQASGETKIAAAQAFAIIGPEASAALPLLTKALEESPTTAGSDASDRRDGRSGRRRFSQPPQSGLSRYAAEAVVSLSDNEETRLLKLAEHPDAEARKVGLEALAAIDNPSAATL